MVEEVDTQISIHAEPQSDRKSLSVYCSVTAVCPGVQGEFCFLILRLGQAGKNEGLVLDPTNGLHLVGVSLGAELVVVSVLALVSVSLQDVLVATVTRELVGNPAAKGGRERERGGRVSQGQIKEYNTSFKETCSLFKITSELSVARGLFTRFYQLFDS